MKINDNDSLNQSTTSQAITELVMSYPVDKTELQPFAEAYSTLPDHLSLEDIESLIVKTGLSAQEVLEEGSRFYSLYEPNSIDKKYQFVKILQDHFKIYLVPPTNLHPIGEFAYITGAQFKQIEPYFDKSFLLKSIIFGSAELFRKLQKNITSDQIIYIADNIGFLTKNAFFEILEWFVSTYIESKITDSHDDVVKLASLLILSQKQKYDLEKHLMLSPANPICSNNEYLSFKWDSTNIKQQVQETFPSCASTILGDYFNQIFGFLDRYPPEILLLTEFSLQPSYANSRIISWYTSNKQSLKFCATFVHEAEHYMLDKIFNNVSNPYPIDEGSKKFKAAATVAFKEALCLLNTQIKINTLDKLLAYENYSDAIKAIQNNEDHKFLFSVFQVIYVQALLKYHSNLDIDISSTKEQMLEALRLLNDNEKTNELPKSDNEIKQQCIKTANDLLKNFKTPDQEAIKSISALIDQNLYNQDEHDSELVVRFHESMINANGSYSDIFKPISVYWQEVINPALTQFMGDVVVDKAIN